MGISLSISSSAISASILSNHVLNGLPTGLLFSTSKLHIHLIILISDLLKFTPTSINLVQHITEPTHISQHLLNYIISDAKLVNSADVSDLVSDHFASLVCTHSLPKRLIYCPLILGKSILTLILKNVDSIVDNYNTVFTSLLDKHAPLKLITLYLVMCSLG